MNEVEETIRAIDVQIEEFKKKSKEANHAYDEFSLKCEKTLKKRDFDFISGLLYRLVKYYDYKIEESQSAKKEILDKYDIPYGE